MVYLQRGAEMKAIKIVLAVLVATVLLSFVAVKVSSGSVIPAKTSTKTYALGHAKKCKVDFVKKTERHKVKGKEKRYIACVYVAPKIAVSGIPIQTNPATTTPAPAPTPVTNLAVHLDPSFVQSASNPLSVTYTASAAATQTVGNSQSQLASLPQGVLDFYSDGNLACSTNVGGDVTTTQCPVTYTALGEHTVITEFVSGTDSATETDIEDITGQSTATTVQLSGDPTQGATVSTLTATVSSVLGTDVTLASGAITFVVDGAVLHTTQANQVTCTLDWVGPTFDQSDDIYLASATTPDCSITGTLLQNVSHLTYSATFAGVLGLTASSSTSSSLTDWPQAPAPITNYVTGDAYDYTIGAVALSGDCISGSEDYCYLNAPTVTLVDSINGQSVTDPNKGFGDDHMVTTLTDTTGNVFIPGTGEACDFSSGACLLGIPYYTPVPSPLTVTMIITPPNGFLIDAPAVITWIGDQEITTITTHALVGSESVQDLAS